MTPINIILLISAYFLILFLISYLTGKNDSNSNFFVGGRKSPWYIVAFGMLGASLSGVTFISVPGWVGGNQFSYMQMVFGYFLGYIFIAHVLLPIYYSLNLTSIYSYLDKRFGKTSYKTGAIYFLISRTIGASFRLFLVANVLQITVFDAWNVPFAITVGITIILIYIYTYRGGIKTIVWTDTLQTLFLLLALVLTIVFLVKDLELQGSMISSIKNSDYSKIFFFEDWRAGNHFLKQFLSGAFITIVMTGLDQDMMQKNLSCKNLKDAKKNMLWYGAAFVPINLLFLSMGVLLFMFANKHGIQIPERSDDLYPIIATSYLPKTISLLFIVGLIAAAYSSADSALTALTTSFSIDILEADKMSPEKAKRTRKISHLVIAVTVGVVIIIFKATNNESVISSIFKAATYTYGPLLGLFAFGLFTKRQTREKLTPIITIIPPILCYFLNKYSVQLLDGYKFGYEILMLNGLLVFLGLLMFSKKQQNTTL